jgi:diacylglycerol O-acyltransferase / wax synthase
LLTGQDRLGAEDAEILASETGTVVGHTLKVLVLDPPPDPRLFFRRLRTLVRDRLSQVPRLRQRPATLPLGLGRPVWVDDPHFDLDHHLRLSRWRRPLSAEDFQQRVAAAMERPLDRRRPLWSLEMIHPLGAGRAGLIWKMHHCMADGLATLSIGERLLWDAAGGETGPRRPSRWRPSPPPSTAELLLGALQEHGRRAVTLAEELPAALRAARRLPLDVPGLARGAAAAARELMPLAGSSPLDAEVGRGRRVAFVQRPLQDLHGIAGSFGVRLTVNDVVLAAVAGGLRRWLENRRASLDPLRVSVPVSLHHSSEPHALGNEVTDIHVDLPVQEPDPVRRLLAINAETSRRKVYDADVLDSLVRFSRLVPPLRRLLSALQANPHVFSLAVSNLPGPRGPIWVAGVRVRELHSVVEVAQRHALRVAAVSCDGLLSFGLCAASRAVPDLAGLAAGMEETIEELKAVASEQRPAGQK